MGACIAIAMLALVPSCGRSPELSSAEACAMLVQQVRSDAGRVELTGTPVKTTEGQVEIAYRVLRTGDDPIDGTAECTFSVGGGGRIELIGAVVDGEPVGPAAVGAANRALGEPEPPPGS